LAGFRVIGYVDKYVVPLWIERNSKGNLRVYTGDRLKADSYLNFDDLGEKEPGWLCCIKLTTTEKTVISEYEEALKRKQKHKRIRIEVWRGVVEVDEDTLPDDWEYEIIDHDDDT
jgi:hypothetical protein